MDVCAECFAFTGSNQSAKGNQGAKDNPNAGSNHDRGTNRNNGALTESNHASIQ